MNEWMNEWESYELWLWLWLCMDVCMNMIIMYIWVGVRFLGLAGDVYENEKRGFFGAYDSNWNLFYEFMEWDFKVFPPSAATVLESFL